MINNLRRLTATFAAAMSLSTLANTASADNVEATVRAGKATTLSSFAIYNRANCGFAAKPKWTVTGGPAHGKVSVQWARIRLGQTDGDACDGKPAMGMLITYTPDRGYRGPDKFKIGFRSEIFGSMSYYNHVRYDLTVK